MFKHEDFTLNADFSPTSDMVIQENFTIESPPFDIDISNIHIMPMIGGVMPGDLMVLSPQLEDTMDVATKFERPEFNPISPRGPPERKVFAGDMDFQVEISALDTNKKKYLYSNQLNRIYVDMKTDFPVSFRWSGGAPLPAFVRACVVFSDESQAEKRVERCTQHTHEASNADINQAIVKNVLHSSREIGTHGVHYCGRPDQPDSWYSVVVELGPTGGSHAYQFMCKNSCSSGINRRAIEVIFTLEDWNGNVYGRQTVGARVCACPRRDMLRDQDEAAGARGKRRAPPSAPPGAPPGAPPSAPAAPHTKKIKLETVGVDDTLITLPPLQIVGSRAVIAGLQTMLAMMEAAAEMRGNALYAPHVAALKDKIEELKRPH